jgi:hypothetical protein
MRTIGSGSKQKLPESGVWQELCLINIHTHETIEDLGVVVRQSQQVYGDPGQLGCGLFFSPCQPVSRYFVPA